MATNNKTLALTDITDMSDADLDALLGMDDDFDARVAFDAKLDAPGSEPTLTVEPGLSRAWHYTGPDCPTSTLVFIEQDVLCVNSFPTALIEREGRGWKLSTYKDTVFTGKTRRAAILALCAVWCPAIYAKKTYEQKIHDACEYCGNDDNRGYRFCSKPCKDAGFQVCCAAEKAKYPWMYKL